ncbi:hypothetical protein [Bacillus sp. JJ722]|uniref:hypothetical protein n=1 Tax=Bacillus sp. JJ722 TaxID=3122973 RepID=UPI00300061BF
MSKYEFSYNIWPERNVELFKQYLEILKNIPKCKLKGNILEDIDGSLLGIFKLKGKNIVLKDDEYVGALYIDSEIDISKYLPVRPNT